MKRLIRIRTAGGRAGGVLLNRRALWVGLHYSPYNRRYCLQVLPGITFWYIKKGGNLP